VALHCLMRLRDICEQDILIEWFQNPQDRVEINKVVVACKDKPLWRQMAAMNKFTMAPLERYRRWGMVCGCPEHILAREENPKKK
jgi:hypothetical protein